MMMMMMMMMMALGQMGVEGNLFLVYPHEERGASDFMLRNGWEQKLILLWIYGRPDMI